MMIPVMSKMKMDRIENKAERKIVVKVEVLMTKT